MRGDEFQRQRDLEARGGRPDGCLHCKGAGRWQREVFNGPYQSHRCDKCNGTGVDPNVTLIKDPLHDFLDTSRNQPAPPQEGPDVDPVAQRLAKLKAEGWIDRLLSAVFLGKQGDAGCIEALERVSQADDHPQVRAAAVEAISKIKARLRGA
jgi:hypothetical protein